jgi:signal transduction histidine kinase
LLMMDAPAADAGVREQVQEAYSLIENAIVTTRRLTVDLSPLILNGEGLFESLQWLQSQMDQVHGLRVAIHVDGEIPTIAEDMRVLLFQLVRELLFNVVKHAGVDAASIELSAQEQQLTISVVDEGVGMDFEGTSDEEPAGGGFGLYSIRERLGLFGGRLEIRSVPGEGTITRILVPIEDQVSVESPRPIRAI